ncbi:MAG: DUF429 domain-containing protein [Paracoccaceae bacterium]
MQAVHCDWSVSPDKRVMAQARRVDGCWRVSPPEPVDDPATLIDRLSGRGPVLLGLDLPIGLPLAYARVAEITDFRTALPRFAPAWFDVCDTPEEISPDRPFYPRRPGGARRAQLLNGLGMIDPQDLLRRCERATSTRSAACSLFWTLGGNQVGKAAISAWGEVLRPAVGRIALWPFDGDLPDLLSRDGLTVAETYPADVYGRLGLPRRGWSKRAQAGRQAVAQPIVDWLERHALPDAELAALVRDGFGTGASGEDAFDALVGLIGMLDVIDGRMPDHAPADPRIRQIEGWILGQSPT